MCVAHVLLHIEMMINLYIWLVRKLLTFQNNFDFFVLRMKTICIFFYIYTLFYFNNCSKKLRMTTDYLVLLSTGV